MKLPNSCAVVAACAQSYLQQAGIKTRTICIQVKKKELGESHVVVLFEVNGRVRGYDENGTSCLPKTLLLQSEVMMLAKAWQRSRNNLSVISAADW